MKTILLVEDERVDAEIVRRCLIGSEYESFHLVHCRLYAEAAAWLTENNADIILADLHLPDTCGIETYRAIQQSAPRTPVIVLTGTSNEVIANKAISEGAQDYLCKSDLARRLLVRCIGYSIQRSQMQNELRYLAYHDELTGLSNRSSFNDIIQRIVDKNPNSRKSFAVLYIDLDDFKTINDCLGHAAGDELLIVLAERLNSAIRAGDVVSRFGGDEFTVLLKNADSIEKIESYIDRIQTEFAIPIFISETEIRASASIGAVLSGPTHQNVECIIRDADTAMYHAKALGKGRHAIFDHAMHQKVRDKLVFSAEVRNALENGEFVLHYQPILSLHTDAIVGFEALLRWPHPTRGLIGPDQFLHMIDGPHSMATLGRFVLNVACHQMKKWRDMLPELIETKVCVNVSPQHFSTDSLFEEISTALSESGLPANGIEIEITEEGYIENVDAAIATAKKLQQHGIRLAIDDFGTGYSSLTQLARFPFDTLKIDREFVRTLGDDPQYGSLFINAITNLAEALSVKVVAEGIEYQWQKSKLYELNCHFGQGYLFAKPMSADAVPNWVVQHTRPVTRLLETHAM